MIKVVSEGHELQNVTIKPIKSEIITKCIILSIETSEFMAINMEVPMNKK
ncbi:MAG: hypothetical protein AB7U98_12290 [Candidatus Nitrosocosmicus sp.]